LAQGVSDETVLIEMLTFMPAMKSLLDSVPKKEIEQYFHEYDGFYYYLKALERLAQGIAAGKVAVPD